MNFPLVIVHWVNKLLQFYSRYYWPKGMDNVHRADSCRILPCENQVSFSFTSHDNGCSAEKIYFHMDWKMKGALSFPGPYNHQGLIGSQNHDQWENPLFPKADIVPNFCLCLFHSKELPYSKIENTQQDRNLASATCNLRTTVSISPWNRLILLGHSFSLSILLNPFNTYLCCSETINYYEI